MFDNCIAVKIQSYSVFSQGFQQDRHAPGLQGAEIASEWPTNRPQNSGTGARNPKCKAGVLISEV
jgi:hypothetical protein